MDINVDLVDPKKNIIDSSLPLADILVISRFRYTDLVDFSKASNLKWVHVTSSGSDDIALTLKNTSIMLTNSSGVSAIPIAEHVFTYMLMFARQFIFSYRVQMEKKRWSQNPNTLLPTELYNKRLGIVGYGRVGKRIACIAKGFGMMVSALAYHMPLQDIYTDMAYTPIDLNKLLKFI